MNRKVNGRRKHATLTYYGGTSFVAMVLSYKVEVGPIKTTIADK